MSNEIATPTVTFSPPAFTFVDMQRMAQAIARSGLFGVKTPDQALALMLVSQSEGRHPALAARDYNIIGMRPSKTAEAMQRDFLAAGGKIKWQELSDTAAIAEFSHPNGGSVTIKWDLAQANRAGLGGKDMWKKYPRQMLRARCVSEGVRTVFPAATSGMYVPEEVRDFGPADTAVGTTIEATADTADVLDQFASGGDVEPPPVYDVREETRSASLRGVTAFRRHWKTLSPVERSMFSQEEMAAFEVAAKAADEQAAENDPFGLPPTQSDLLHQPAEEPTR